MDGRFEFVEWYGAVNETDVGGLSASSYKYIFHFNFLPLALLVRLGLDVSA